MLCVLGKHVDMPDQDESLIGGNVRCGGPIGNVFAEYVYEEVADVVKRTLAYGGEYRVDGNKVIEAGIRTEYNSSWDLADLVPQVKVRWSFAKDFFK